MRIKFSSLLLASILVWSAGSVIPQKGQASNSASLSPEVQSYCDWEIKDWLVMPPAKQIMVFHAVVNAFADKVKPVNPGFSDKVRVWYLIGNGRDSFDTQIKKIDQTKTMYGAVAALASEYKSVLDQRSKN